MVSSCKKFINSMKDKGLRCNNIETINGGSNAVVESSGQQNASFYAGVYRAYEEECHRSHCIDFGEILLRTFELLLQYPDILDKYRRQFQYIHVDEFQDTNTIQYKMLYLLATGHQVPDAATSKAQDRSTKLQVSTSLPIAKTIPPNEKQLEFPTANSSPLSDAKIDRVGGIPNLFVVGDDDQAIYGFRGAFPDILQRVLADFPLCKVVKLEQNYRSTATILTAANAVIGRNVNRIGKTLWTSKELSTPSGPTCPSKGNNLIEDCEPPIRVHSAKDEESEAVFVANEISTRTAHNKRKTAVSQQQERQRGASNSYSYSDIAVLYRTNTQSRALEVALQAQRIPYTVVAGNRLLDREEARHAMAYLQLMVNHHHDAAFERIANVPSRGMSPKVMTAIKEYGAAHGTTLWDAAIALSDDSKTPMWDLSVKSQGHVKSFIELIAKMSEDIHTGAVSFAKLGSYVLTQSRLREYYEGVSKKETKSALLAMDKLSNLEAFESIVCESAKRIQDHQKLQDEDAATATPLQQLLHELVLDKHENAATAVSSIQSSDDDTPSVQLMTIHAAKGLEFPVVFLVGAEEGLLPRDGRQSSDDDDELLPLVDNMLSFKDNASNMAHRHSNSSNSVLEEARRLFYVAVTRAKHVLYFTHCRRRAFYGNGRGKQFSKFNFFEKPQAIKRSRFLNEIKPKHIIIESSDLC
jgi:DNA helicase II / ATP-dependent DNA helicase PcrA